MKVNGQSQVRIDNPAELDMEQIERELDDGKHVIVQFSRPSAYGSMLPDWMKFARAGMRILAFDYTATIPRASIAALSCKFRMSKRCTWTAFIMRKIPMRLSGWSIWYI